MNAEKSLPAIASGRVAVITGSASGIGLAAARRLAALGMKVVLADREGAALDHAADAVGAVAPGGEDDVAAFACDVADPDDLANLADGAFDKFGEVSLLMNNAGVGDNPGKPWENRDGWKRLVEINFWGAVHGVEAFAPRMLAAGKPGLIVNTGSKQGITTPPGNLAYNVSKAALNAITRVLADSVQNDRILVNSVCPGWVRTDMGGENAPRSVEEGADTAVWLATLPDDGPTGGFFRDGQSLPW